MSLPNEVSNALLGGSADEFSIARSLRFNDGDTANLTRTPGASNRRTWTFSCWVKRGLITPADNHALLYAGTGGLGHDLFRLMFQTTDKIWFEIRAGDASVGLLNTTAVYRDPGAWTHVVAIMDTTNATAGDRMRLYINGLRVTSFSTQTNPAQNTDTYVNFTQQHGIGKATYTSANYLDGYIAEIHFTDGTTYDASFFGEFDSVTGAWKAKEVTGLTYGTNGYWLSFADNTSTTTLGRDDAGGEAGSGAGANDWTLNNFSVTAGVGNDSLTDTPTNNFAVFNKMSPVTTGTLANGGMDCSASGIAIGSFGMTTGKWYWEITSTGGTTTCAMYNTAATTTTTVTTGVTKGFRYDADAGTFDWTTDGSGWTSITTGLLTWPYFIYVSTAAATVASLNSGQRPFAYTQPAGYKKLSTSNLPTPLIRKPSSYFEAKTYTGTGASLIAASGMNFQPDLVWIKGRSGATSHSLYDAVRGVQKNIATDSTVDEAVTDAGLTSFNSDGFTVNTLAKVNTSSATYVGWCWKEGTIPGFDIVNYTGTGANRTIAHSLGVVPKLMIVKARTTASTDQAGVLYHSSLLNTEYMVIQTTAAKATGATYWNSTTPTSSVFSLGTAVAVNALNDTYINYLFAEVAGFSKFGSYIGNGGADGPFVWCGFKPRFVLIKPSSTTSRWTLYDNVRQTYNVQKSPLFPNNAGAEVVEAGGIDILSNGFKLRWGDTVINASGATYIFIAFAESPFKYATAS